MAELASGAVRSLLGVLRDEARLLGRVKGDLKFIQEEMESMNSFLQHLDRTTPHGDHDEQVRTWMKQVRDLAYDCSNYIDLYLLRRDPTVYRPTGPVRRYLWLLVPWFLQKLYAQHCAAIQLREFKDRARDVGKRRLRYDVKIPEKSGGKSSGPDATSSSSQTSGGGDDGIIPSDDEQTPKDEAMRPRILEECTQELVNWLSRTEVIASWLNEDRLPSIAIAAPGEEDGADVAREALAHPSMVATNFEHKLWITFPWFLPASPYYILEEILGELLPEAREGERARTEGLDRKIEEIVKKTKEHLQAAGIKRSPRVVPLEPLDILCDILQELLSKSVDKDQIEEKINETAMKIKKYLEELDTNSSWIGLDHSDYVGILRELLPQPKEDKPEKEATDKLGDDQIAKNIKEVLQELLSKPREDTDNLGEDHIEEKIKETTEHIIDNLPWLKLLPKRKEGMDKLDEDQMSQEKIEKIIDNIERILENIKEHLLVKEIAEHLEGKRTIIILDGMNYTHKWRETNRALNQLGCAAGSAVIVTTQYTQGTEEFCNPKREAIIYSLVDFYYRKVLHFTSRRETKDCNEYIFREILQRCEPHEFCMKMFVHAMYANPDKSREDLEKLRDTLVFRGPLDINAEKMLMFSCGDLPTDYRTCLLYLAIFPRGDKIRRSTLVGRWVAEGLITKEDWPSSVHRAEKCFDVLVDRWLVYPGDIGAAGKVKSCTVRDIIVHEFITKIARKEHFVETRLAHNLARHFSVLSDVRLRSSDSMEEFLQKLYKIPQSQLVKVLDLEGCKNICNKMLLLKKNQHYIKNIFKKNQDYLKNICNKMLLLKYLSLRKTDITKLPKEINNLYQLEVLDIRQTKVRADATKDVLLLKLKRLLAGHMDTGTVSSVQIPGRIERMTNMEVLSHVKASRDGDELKEIGKLWQLRKLGVVIKDDHLGNLLQAISDLNECLQSLSITLPRSEGTLSSAHLLKEINDRLRKPPKLLESLSISGITSGQLLPFLAKSRDQLTKVTLHNTLLNQNDLKDLAKLPKLLSVRLRHGSYNESKLTFKKDEFQNLKYFLVEGFNMTEISFEYGAAPTLEKIVLCFTDMNSISFEVGAAPELEKIILSFTNINSLRGVDSLPKLKEVELNGNGSPLPLFDNANRIAKVTLRDTLLQQGDLQILAKKPNMRCLMLLDKSCDEIQLTFNKDEFPKLSLLVVECTCITNISFSEGAVPKLEKIAWSFTSTEPLSGIGNLPKLKELEFNGTNVPDQVIEAIKAHRNSPVLKHNIPQNEVQGTGSAAEAEDATCFPFFRKNKDQCSMEPSPSSIIIGRIP